MFFYVLKTIYTKSDNDNYISVHTNAYYCVYKHNLELCHFQLWMLDLF